MVLDKKLLTRILYGSAFLGSGGGGLIESGRKFLEEIGGSKVSLLTFPFSREHGKLLACVVCDMGSITAFDEKQSDALNLAYETLRDYFNKVKEEKKIQAFFPIETGPENTLAPFVLAARFGFYVIDGDGAARAVPTLPLSTFSVGGIKNPKPVSIANGNGDSMLVFTKEPEKILRSVSHIDAFSNSSSLALWPDTVDELFKDCIGGTITRALHCGQLIEGIRENDNKLIEESIGRVNDLSAFVIGAGEVIFKTGLEKGAFNFTTTKIRQKDGSIITIISQNESLIAFSDQSYLPLAIAPDSICYLGFDFNPCTNGEIESIDETVGHNKKAKQQIYVIGVKAHKKLQHQDIRNGFKKIIEELGYAGNMDIKTPKQKPLGDLLMGLRRLKA
jgi:DUF917 family protein